MTLTPSTMLELGHRAPPFRLPDTDGAQVSLDDFKGKPGLLVMFICNHCPFVQHVAGELTRLATDYMSQGVGVVAINSNDVKNYPDDRPELMKIEKAQRRYPFAYLFDESQEVAKAFRAACTPDFYVFDQNLRLAYRGQLDDSRPGNNAPVTGESLRQALDALLSGRSVAAEQKPSIGCNIKWKSNQAPDYYKSLS